MKFKVGKLTIYIEYTFIALIIIMLLFGTIRQYFENYCICFLFIIFHESAHVFIASLFGVECTKINVRVCGLNAVFKPKSKLSIFWLYVLLAGPIANCILALIFSNISIVREVNLALAIINLLPISPLDGYSICSLLLSFILPEYKVKMILKLLKYTVLLLLFILAILVFILSKNPSVLLFVLYVVTLRNARN